MSNIGSIEITGELFSPVITNATYEELESLRNANINTEARNAIIFSVPNKADPYNAGTSVDDPDKGSIWLTDQSGYLYCISKPYSTLTSNFITNTSAQSQLSSISSVVSTLEQNQVNYVTSDNLDSQEFASKGYVQEIINTVITEKLRNVINGASDNYDSLKELEDALKIMQNKVNDISNILSLKSNSDDVYTSSQIDTKINFLDVYSKSEIDRKIAYLENLLRLIYSGGGVDVDDIIPAIPQKQYYWYISQTVPSTTSLVVFENKPGWRYIGTSTDGYVYEAIGSKTISSVDNSWAPWYLALPKDSDLSIFNASYNIDVINSFENVGSLLYNNIEYNIIKLKEATKFTGWIIKGKEGQASPQINFCWCASQEMPNAASNWIPIGKLTDNYDYKAVNDNIIQGSDINTWYVALPHESNLSIFNMANNIDFYNAFNIVNSVIYNNVLYDVFKTFRSSKFENFEIKNRTESSPYLKFYCFISNQYPSLDRFIVDPNDPTKKSNGWYPIDDICDFMMDTRGDNALKIDKINSSMNNPCPWYVAIPKNTDLTIYNAIGNDQLFSMSETNESITFKNVDYKIIIFNFVGGENVYWGDVAAFQNNGKFKGWVITNAGREY